MTNFCDGSLNISVGVHSHLQSINPLGMDQAFFALLFEMRRRTVELCDFRAIFWRRRYRER